MRFAGTEGASRRQNDFQLFDGSKRMSDETLLERGNLFGVGQVSVRKRDERKFLRRSLRRFQRRYDD